MFFAFSTSGTPFLFHTTLRASRTAPLSGGPYVGAAAPWLEVWGATPRQQHNRSIILIK